VSGIGVITNLNSKRNKTGAYCQKKMEAILGPLGPSRDTRTLREIPPVIREFRDRMVEVICVNGGDGTQHYVANEIVKVYGENALLPPVVPLRGGVMNMLSKNFGVTGTPAKTLARVKELYSACKKAGKNLPVRHCGTLLVSCPSSGYRGIGFVYATGIAYTLLSQYYEGGEPSFRNAVNVVTSAIYGFVLGKRSARSAFEHVEARISVEGKPLPFPTILIAVASVIPRLVLWFKPFCEHGEPRNKPGFYFMANDMDNWEVIRNVRTLSRGILNSHEKIFNDVVNTVTIESSCGYTLDGELFPLPGRAEVTISPGPSFNFLSL